MIPEEVHIYMAETGRSLGDLEVLALRLIGAYEKERACVEPKKRFSLPAAKKQPGALEDVWLKLAMTVDQLKADPAQFMVVAFRTAPPYPYIRSLAHKKFVDAYMQSMSGDKADMVDRPRENLDIWIQGFRDVMSKYPEKSPPNVMMSFIDRYNELFAWCILSRLGYPEDAHVYKQGAQQILRDSPRYKDAYAQIFKEEIDKL